MKTFKEFIAESKVVIDDGPYRRANRKKPSGNGRWSFGVSPTPDLSSSNEGKTYISTKTGDYKDSVKQAVEWAQKNNLNKIYVLS